MIFQLTVPDDLVTVMDWDVNGEVVVAYQSWLPLPLPVSSARCKKVRWEELTEVTVALVLPIPARTIITSEVPLVVKEMVHVVEVLLQIWDAEPSSASNPDEVELVVVTVLVDVVVEVVVVGEVDVAVEVIVVVDGFVVVLELVVVVLELVVLVLAAVPAIPKLTVQYPTNVVNSNSAW